MFEGKKAVQTFGRGVICFPCFITLICKIQMPFLWFELKLFKPGRTEGW